MKTFSIPSLQFFEEIVHPVFGDDAVEALGFRGTLSEFTVMDNVSSSRPIIDIRRAQNIMQRRDASCDIIYKNLFGATTRKVTTEEIYAAVKFCRNEFYQGCLKDFRAKDPVFAEKILPYFRTAVNTDLTTNAYFGDPDRVIPGDPTLRQFSTDMFDGVFKWMAKYTTSGLIPSGQAFAISDAANFLSTPSQAYDIIKELYDAMPELMRTFTDDQLAFYVSPEIKRGFEQYLIATGSGNVNYTEDVMTGIKVLKYSNIAILEEPLWSPTILELKGGSTKGYAAILTVRGNFIYATDKSYGEGEDGHTALEVWYDKEKMTWKYRMFLKSGTQIALPEFIVYAKSSWV